MFSSTKFKTFYFSKFRPSTCIKKSFCFCSLSISSRSFIFFCHNFFRKRKKFRQKNLTALFNLACLRSQYLPVAKIFVIIFRKNKNSAKNFHAFRSVQNLVPQFLCTFRRYWRTQSARKYAVSFHSSLQALKPQALLPKCAWHI